jgi:hypothetical protein
MTRDDIIRLARESGWTEYSLLHAVEVQRLETFAALIAAEKERHPVAWMWWGDNGDGTESKHVHIGRDFPTYWKPVRPPVPLFTNNSDLVLHQSATSKHKRRL